MTKSENSFSFLPSNCDAEIIDFSHRGGARCQQLLKVRYQGRDLLMKRYGLKRSFPRMLMRQFGSLALVGKSSISISGRYRTERDALALWQQEGFDVPRLYSVPELEANAGPCLVMEWIDGCLLTDLLYKSEIPFEYKAEVLKAFASQWGRRHDRALQISEPRLLMENPTFDHLFLCDERLIHFDLEIVFTRKTDLERLIRREIAGILCSLEKSSGPDFPALLKTLISAYPDPVRFHRTADELERYGSIPVIGSFAWLHRFIRNKGRYANRSLIADHLFQSLQATERHDEVME
ncbi:MAG: hypothetical protein ABIK28_13885 [Planctomycetota bacterium]